MRTLEGKGDGGFNVVRWNLSAEEDDGPRGSFSPYLQFVEPGTYTVRIVAGGVSLEGSLTVLAP